MNYNLFSMRLRIMTKLLPGVIVSLSQTVFAETELSAAVAVNNEGLSEFQSEEQIPVRKVEAGPGGNIKLERKYRSKVESLYEWHAHLVWESRYVTEGRDNLSGNSLVSASTEFSIDEFGVVPWIADSAASDYSEFNLNVVYGSRLTEKIVLYAGYNYVYARFQGEKFNDNEISLDLAYNWIQHVNAVLSIYHSFDAEGSFVEAAIKYNDAINSRVHYSLQGVLGVNANYVPDGHNGLNHFQLRTYASFLPATQIELYANVGYNVAINRDSVQYAGDELPGNL